MKSKFFTVRTIAGLGVLTAMVVVLQLLSNYVQFGPVSITLSLFPIAIGAMLFGPFGGLFLGLVDGVLVLTAPSTISFFFAITPIGTIFVCLLKTGLAGFIAGWIFRLYQKNINVEAIAALVLLPLILLAASDKIFETALANLSWGKVLVMLVRFILVSVFAFILIKGLVRPSKSSVILLTSISVPIINTGLFCVAALTIFSKKILPMASAAGQNAIYFLIFGLIGWNFFLEFGINALLASAFHNAYKSLENNFSRKGN